MMKLPTFKSKLAVAVVVALGISACNQAGNTTTNATTSPVAKTTSGVITGFGSVFINGVEYDTTGTNFVVNGVAGNESSLKLGMVVTLNGSDDANGKGQAVSVNFEDVADGVVIANNVAVDGTLNIMGLTVHTNSDTVFDSADPTITTLNQLVKGNVVEVSGYTDDKGNVWATRIEMQKAAVSTGDSIELKGNIASLTSTTFMIGSMLVDYGSAQFSDNITAADLADGLYVKVESASGPDAQGTLIASNIELKGDAGKKVFEQNAGDEQNEVEGVITAVNSTTSIDVNGLPVTLDSSTAYIHGSASTALVGLKVKVKGKIDANGNLVAQKLVYKPTGDLMLEGAITATDLTTNTFTLFGVPFKLDNFTMVKDEKDQVKYKFGINDLVAGDWLKVKAYFDASGGLTATGMERITPETNQKAQLEGLITSIDNTKYQLVIAGITVDFSAQPGLSNKVGDKLELEGDFVNGVFVATSVQTASIDSHYIGGTDANEQEGDQPDKVETETKDQTTEASSTDSSTDSTQGTTDATSSTGSQTTTTTSGV